MKKKSKIYALYKEEELLSMGTIKELAKEFNVKEKTIYFYSMPTYLKRRSKSKNSRIVVEC